MEVLYGAEYERALKAGFSFLYETQKREYITKIFSLFIKPKDEDEKRWKMHYASCLLSTVSEDLTQEEIVLADKNEFKDRKNFSLFIKPKDEDEKRGKMHYASCLLSTVSEDLTQEEIVLADKNEF